MQCHCSYHPLEIEPRVRIASPVTECVVCGIHMMGSCSSISSAIFFLARQYHSQPTLADTISAEQGPTKTEIGWNLPFSWFHFNQLNAPRATTFISKLSGIINLILCNQGLKNCKIRQIGWKASFWTFKMGDCFYLGRLDAILSKESQLKQRFTSMKPMTWLKANSFYKGKLVVFLFCLLA